MSAGRHPIFTVGHSTHTQERLIELLHMHEVTAVSDVRSGPYSRLNPQFNREELQAALREAGISYVFLGRELGARSSNPACYENGKVQYERLAEAESFRSAIERVMLGSRQHRIALMCAEKEPLECHRTILVGRVLVRAGAEIQHIHADGRLESQEGALLRLRSDLGLMEADLFLSDSDLTEIAYKKQGDRIAYNSEAEGLDIRPAWPVSA